MQNGADVRKALDDKKTALHLAVNSGDDEAKGTLLRAWAAIGGDEAILQTILDVDKIQVDGKDEEEAALISLASESGHEAIVKLLVEKRVDIETKRSGMTRRSGLLDRDTKLFPTCRLGRELILRQGMGVITRRR